MKTIFTLICVTLIQFIVAQKKIPYQIDASQSIVVENSLYNALDVIDARENKRDFGVVDLNPFRIRFDDARFNLKRINECILQKPLEEQFKDVFAMQVTENAKNGKLLLVINRLYFLDSREFDLSRRSQVFCFSADLFVKNNESFNLLSSIDSNLFVSDLPLFRTNSKSLMKLSSELMFNFIETNLTKTPDFQSNFTWNHLNKWDSVLKSTNKIYTNDTLVDGIYYTYESFKKQKPAGVLIETEKSIEELQKIYQLNDTTGEGDKISKRKIYTVVQKGVAYIFANVSAFNRDFVKLVREENDYYLDAMPLMNYNLNSLYKNEVIKMLSKLRLFSIPSMPKIRYLLEPRNGSFTPISLIDKN